MKYLYVYIPLEYLYIQDSLIGVAMKPSLEIAQWLDLHKDECYFDDYRLCMATSNKDLAIEFRMRWS
jgi:hypothetical protein